MNLMFPTLAAIVALSAPAPDAPSTAILDSSAVRTTSSTRAIEASLLDEAGQQLNRPPAPLPRIHTEGTLPGQGIRDISLAAKADHPITLNLALAWRLSGDRRYLDAAGRYLDAWASIYEVSLNPIDETSFDQLILAYDLTEADLPPETRGRLDALWRGMAEGYLSDMEGRHAAVANNWQSHRVKLAALSAFQLGDPALIDRARRAFQRQIAANVRVDGSVHDFHHRDAIHYVTYDLDPLMMAASAAQRNGEDWFTWRTADGVSLQAAVEWLVPYAMGEKVHQEFVNSTVPFDAQRAAAGQREYAPHAWNPANATNTFALASHLSSRFVPVREHLKTTTDRTPAPWMLLTTPAGRPNRTSPHAEDAL